MVRLLKRVWAYFRLPRDPLFNKRQRSDVRVGRYLVVEVGADDYTILMDLLHQIHHGGEDIETKGRQIMGLKYQALAMSLRTRWGRIPFNWRDDRDLMTLASLPYSMVLPALEAAATVSDLPWLSVAQRPAEDSESPAVTPQPLDEKAIAANP